MKGRKVIVLAVIVLLIGQMVFAGCQPTSSTGSSTTIGSQSQTTTGGTSTSSTSSEVNNFNETGYPIVNEKLTFRVLIQNQPTHPSDMNDQALMQRTEELTNIHIEWIMPGAGFAEKKSLMLATGDLPDFFMTGLTANELAKFGDDGTLIPMQDLVDQYAPNLKSILNEVEGLASFCTAPDGNLYGIPRINGGIWMKADGVSSINKAWLDELDLDMPDNTNSFIETMRLFKTEDPNKNDIQDEIPIVFSGTIAGRYGFRALFAPFGVPLSMNFLDVEDGTVFCQATRDEFKEAIEYIAKMYDEGLIDQEGFTMNTSQMIAKISQDPFIAGYIQGWGDFNVDFSNSMARDNYELMPLLKSPDNEAPVYHVIPFSGVMRGAGAITKDCELPEAAMRWIDYCYDERVSFEMCEGDIGERLIEQPDGTLIIGDPPEGQDSQTHRNSLCPGGSGLWSILPEGYEILRNVQTDNKVDYIKTHIFPYEDSEPFPSVFYNNDESEQITLLETSIIQYIERVNSEWIMDGEVGNWDEYLSELEKMGLEQWLTIAQQAYDRFSQ